jgi:hypothetical protein
MPYVGDNWKRRKFLMAAARCKNPECRSADIKVTAPGLLRNSYLCNSCKQPFTCPAPTWVSILGGIGGIVTLCKEVSGLFDDMKRLFSDDPAVGPPEARATLPPRQPPQRHPNPLVHPKRHSVSLNRLNSHKAVVVNDRGVAYCQKGEFDRGIVYFSHAIQLRPGYLEALNNRGYAYNLKREYKLAVDDLDRASQLLPRNAIVFNNRAEVYLIQGKYPLAIRDLTQAIEINPNFGEAFELRAYARYVMGVDIEGAVSDAASVNRIGRRGHNPFLPGTDAAVFVPALILTISAIFTNSSTIQVNWTTDKSTIGFVASAPATQFEFGPWAMSDIAGGYGTNHSTALTVPSGTNLVYVSAVVKSIDGIFCHTRPFPVDATNPFPQSPRHDHEGGPALFYDIRSTRKQRDSTIR